MFYDPVLTGNDYELLHSNMYGEVSNPNWKMMLVRKIQTQQDLYDPNPVDYWGNSMDDLPIEQRKICRKLMLDPRLSSRALAKELGIRRNTVLKQQESLKAKGILVRKGGTRGFWEVNVV